MPDTFARKIDMKMPSDHPGPAANSSGSVRRVPVFFLAVFAAAGLAAADSPRERLSINDNWRFTKGDPNGDSSGLIYDVRPDVKDRKDDKAADAEPTAAEKAAATNRPALKPWILPTANRFISDPAKRHVRPETQPAAVAYAQSNFDDSSWRAVTLPHDWAIEGPFDKTGKIAGGGMGRLPSPGVAWYRKKLDIPAADAGKSIFLDVDGAMSYAMVWLNGQLVGGWPYGYTSWRLDLTPFVVPGGVNQLAIRLDNPPDSARWYTGGGIYRNVWLTKTHPVHVAQWGTCLTTTNVNKSSAEIHLEVTLDNDSKADATVSTATEIFVLDAEDRKTGGPVARIAPVNATVAAGASARLQGSVTLANPKLWGPPPTQKPNRYVAITTVAASRQSAAMFKWSFLLPGRRNVAQIGLPSPAPFW
jgi:beta-galactosidase